MPFSKRTVGQSIDRIDGREKVLGRAMSIPCDRPHSSMVPTSTSTILGFATNGPPTRRRRALSLGTLLAPAFGECMFTDPELARVGKNEVESPSRPHRISVGEVADGRSATHQNDFRAARLDEGAGCQRQRQDSGLHHFAFEASELMVAMQTAMPDYLPYSVLRDAILTHPTMCEGLSQLVANVPVR
jgi:hypothetical protein